MGSHPRAEKPHEILRKSTKSKGYVRSSGVFNITGYTFAFNGPSSLLNPVYQNRKIIAEQHTVTSPSTNFVDDVASRVLIADVVLSGNANLPATAGNSFDSVSGSFYKPHLSAHLRNRVPYGGAICYKDGHVQWKKFSAGNADAAYNDSQVRTVPGAVSSLWPMTADPPK